VENGPLKIGRRNVPLAKNYDFVLKIANFLFRLQSEEKEFAPLKKVLRSGTTIGALAEELKRLLISIVKSVKSKK